VKDKEVIAFVWILTVDLPMQYHVQTFDGDGCPNFPFYGFCVLSYVNGYNIHHRQN